MRQNEQSQHSKNRTCRSPLFIFCFDLEKELGKIKPSIYRLFEKSIAKQLSDQPAKDNCYAPFIPARVNVNIAVNSINDQNACLHGNP